MGRSAPRNISSPTGDPAASRPLAGRHAVVTGGSRGIGAAVTRELLRLGARVTICARSESGVRDFVDLLQRETEISVGGIAGDATSEADVARILEAARSRFGEPAILVNNAGGAESAPFARTDPALWRRMIDLNLTSAYLCTHAAVPAMLAAGWGRVVNIASTAGLKGYGYVSAYVAAKHGVVGLTRALAVEFAGTGITVNAVCPGYTDTPMLEAAIATIATKTKRSGDEARASLAASSPMGRLIAPEEVAAAVGYLCLPAASSVTGATLAIDGGETA